VAIAVVYETHSTSEDNERGVATGWLPGRLSAEGRLQAAELGRRRRDDRLAAVFSSDLARAVETTALAFAGSSIPQFSDWRLRECDYGALNGAPAGDVHGVRSRHIDVPYPGGESWRQAVHRVGGFLDALPHRWASGRILLIGHLATYWALEHFGNGVPLELLATEVFRWQPGWEYHLGDHFARPTSTG
jgi:broad specificity phosphatase PhoE